MKRKKNSFGGIIAGPLVILIGALMLWSNEGNNVANIKSIKEARENLIQVDSTKIDTNNTDSLIATTGDLNVENAVVTDEIFNVTITKTAKVLRKVEMYQWDESSSDDDSYKYSKKWSEVYIDSNDFHNTSYINPKMPYESNVYLVEDVKVGDFTLDKDMVDLLKVNNTYDLGICGHDCKYRLAAGYRVVNNYITNSKDLNNPEIGDVRISYLYNSDSKVSVLGKQINGTITKYESSEGKVIARIESGEVTGEEMINFIEKDNNFRTWVLRIVGLIFMGLGVSALLTPIVTITSFIPIVGNRISGFISSMGFLLGVGLGAVVIAVAWLSYRPLLALAILAVVVCIVIFVIKSIKKIKNSTTQPSQMVYTNGTVNMQNMYTNGYPSYPTYNNNMYNNQVNMPNNNIDGVNQNNNLNN